ncbi:tRNA endonuclease ANKZF1-like isoform X2 [Panulirus ornatus]|uniref:tRNA endonuclease ANKZF1-like isoform X2 n=1 Tax=Panulirus ornatus TaxID=150431 RepID=UPI003A88318B
MRWNPSSAGIRLAPGSAEYEQLSTHPSSSPSKEHCSNGLSMFRLSLPTTLTEMRCSYCQATFTDRQDQVDHYRLDWHRCNIQRSMAGKSPLTEEQFMNDLSDVSSISGSEDDLSDDDNNDDDDDDDEEDKETQDSEADNLVLRRQARLFFLNADGNVISLFRNVLVCKKYEIEVEEDVIQRVRAAPRRQNWAVILLGGGSFAAAVFRGNEVIIHKTFHNYTVRAKQGGSQSSKDNQNNTSHPKSSGASLRRYNEQSQCQHIQEMMESWEPHLAKCHLIFYHANHHNRRTLFSGKKPVLCKQDERLRKIPFTTRRAKFSEVKRIFGLLSEILVHGTEEEFRDMVKDSLVEVKANVKKKKYVPEKKHERKAKLEKKSSSPDLPLPQSDSESDDSNIELVTSFSTLSFCELGERDVSFKRHRKKKVNGNKMTDNKKTTDKRKKKTPTATDEKDKQGDRHKTQVWTVLYTACKTGNIENLKTALKIPSTSHPQDYALSDELLDSIACTEIPSNLSAITLGRKDRTMLHVAAENGHKDIVWWLLEHGCDPSIGDSDKFLPYDVASNKDTRNQFRRFMAQNPERFDYKKAKVPSPLTPDQEAQKNAKLNERRKKQKQEKQERQKEKKQQEREAKKEEEEKKRFLELSDREKRAIAAERRFLRKQEEVGAPIPCLLRCFMCAKNITGIVPFEYSDNKFCSTKCVKEHRMKNS